MFESTVGAREKRLGASFTLAEGQTMNWVAIRPWLPPVMARQQLKATAAL
jgi:hypothetical protein